jgi:hypothetical protein
MAYMAPLLWDRADLPDFKVPEPLLPRQFNVEQHPGRYFDHVAYGRALSFLKPVQRNQPGGERTITSSDRCLTALLSSSRRFEAMRPTLPLQA